MAMTDLNELLERVKKATGPDREFDSDLGFALGWYAKGYDYYAWAEADGTFVESVNPKPFTASIDAALAVVERLLKGWDFSIENMHEDGCYAKVWEHGWHDDTSIEGSATTAPLAILSALLSALIAKESSNGQ